MLLAAASADASFARLLACLAFVGIVTKIVGAVARRVGQPAVVGEIVAGIALGPSVLGLVRHDLPGRLFPTSVVPDLRLVSELGLVLFMFCVGLELDPEALRASGRRAAAISLSSIALPFVLGVGVLAPALYHAHSTVGGRHVPFAPFGLFLGVSMCGTAFAVLARVLAEHGLLGSRLGTLLMSCAAIDDVVAFTLLGLVVAVASAGSAPAAGLTIVGFLALVGVLRLAVRPLLRRLVTAPFELGHRAGVPARPEALAIIVLGALASAAVTQRIGLHPMIGAFVFGTSVPLDARRLLATELHDRLEAVSVHLLMPVFFVVTGLGVDIAGLRRADVGAAVLVLVVACTGKFVGATGAARAMGVERREALAIGTLMNTRGLAELVILNVGRSIGVLDDRMFTMLVIMAVVTTVMAGPVLRLVYPDRLLAGQRAEARAMAMAQAQAQAQADSATAADDDALAPALAS